MFLIRVTFADGQIVEIDENLLYDACSVRIDYGLTAEIIEVINTEHTHDFSKWP